MTGSESLRCWSDMPSEPTELVFLRCFRVRITVFMSTGSGRKRCMLARELRYSVTLLGKNLHDLVGSVFSRKYVSLH